MTEKRRAILSTDELEEDSLRSPCDSLREQSDSPVFAVLKHYGSPETRDEYINLFYMGDVPDEILAEDECEFPEKFQLATLLETPPASERVQ